MAGIGFELKRMMARHGALGHIQAYVYAGIIGSGPWVFSMVGMLLVSGLSFNHYDNFDGNKFLTSVTYLISASLVLSGAAQLVFVRFASDCIYTKKEEWIIPNLLGMLGLVTLCSALIGLAIIGIFFEESVSYSLLMLVNFIVLCNLWVILVLASSMKQYHAILFSFLGGYTLILLLAGLLKKHGVNGGLIAIFTGHVLLLLPLLIVVFRNYQSPTEIRLEFINKNHIYPILIIIGILFNLGVWIDKWLFWINSNTSESIGGILRFSVVYDTPFFLAYLSIIPGMAAFLLKVETDFVEAYQNYYAAVNGSGTLSIIEEKRQVLLASIRDAFWVILKVQGITTLLFFAFAKKIIAWLGLSPLYVHLYYLDLFSVLMQVFFLTTLSMVFYFNFLHQALWMTLGLFISNVVFTLLSLWLGAAFYGYGLAIALSIMTFLGMWGLSGKLDRLEYLTFMMQR